MKQMVTHPDFFTAIYFILSGQEECNVCTMQKGSRLSLLLFSIVGLLRLLAKRIWRLFMRFWWGYLPLTASKISINGFLRGRLSDAFSCRLWVFDLWFRAGRKMAVFRWIMLEKHQILRSRAANNLKSGGLRFSHKPHAKNNHPNLRTHPRQPDCNHLTKKFTQRNAEGMDNSYR